jgi:type I restriction enzyme S subunit
MSKVNGHTVNKNGWRWVSLGEAVDVLDNLRKPINSDERKKRIASKSQSELYPYYGATGQVGWIDDFITEGEFILVGEDGAPFLDRFKEKAYKIKGRTWVNNHAHILRQKEDLTLNDFILHYLNSISYNNFVNGTTRLKLTKGSLTDIPFPLPSVDEQQQIVSKIEELFSELDKSTEQLKTAQQQLKVYRQSVLKWAFEGKLTNENVVDGNLPEGWTIVLLKEVGKISGGLTKNLKREELPIKKPFLRVANVYLNRIDLDEVHVIGLKESELERVLLKKNDLLFVEGNGSLDQIGRVAIWGNEIKDCVHQNHLIKVRLSEKVLPKFALHFFCSKRGRDFIKQQASSTSGLHTLSLAKIEGLQLPFTSIEEQQLIIQEIESRLSVADKLEKTINDSLQQAEALRQSILKKAFEGVLF